MEVIAERKKSASKIFVWCIIAGAMCLALIVVVGIFYALGEAELDALLCCGIMLLIVGVGFLVTGIVMVRKMKFLPKRIVRDGDKIDFDNGFICTADKIENVTYHEYRNNRGMHRFSYGSLTVHVNGTVLNYEFIANVEQAHNRLIQLMIEATKK